MADKKKNVLKNFEISASLRGRYNRKKSPSVKWGFRYPRISKSQNLKSMLYFSSFLSDIILKSWYHDHAGMPKILYEKWSFLTNFDSLPRFAGVRGMAV